MSVGTRTRRCSARTRLGFRCRNEVLPGTRQCAAGHVNAVRDQAIPDPGAFAHPDAGVPEIDSTVVEKRRVRVDPRVVRHVAHSFEETPEEQKVWRAAQTLIYTAQYCDELEDTVLQTFRSLPDGEKRAFAHERGIAQRRRRRPSLSYPGLDGGSVANVAALVPRKPFVDGVPKIRRGVLLLERWQATADKAVLDSVLGDTGTSKRHGDLRTAVRNAALIGADPLSDATLAPLFVEAAVHVADEIELMESDLKAMLYGLDRATYQNLRRCLSEAERKVLDQVLTHAGSPTR